MSGSSPTASDCVPEPVPDCTPAERRRALTMLGVAVLLAVAAALLMRDEPRLEPDLVARVGNESIRRVDFERTVAMLADDKRSPLTDDDIAVVLDRMIEERLLVQAGIERGLVRSDPDVRARLRQTLLTSILAEAEIAEPSAAELRRYYEEHRAELGEDFASARPRMLEAHRRFEEQLALERYLRRLRASAEITRHGDRARTQLPSGRTPELPSGATPGEDSE